jgi:molybdenum cofactor cytidylyltransferase
VGVTRDASVIAAILAAGAARRMGAPKQLLPFNDGTLLGHAIDEALSTGFDQLLVVLGANATEIKAKLEATSRGRHASVEFIENDRWETGLASSIRAAVSHVQGRTTAGPKAIAILLADQPRVTAAHLQKMRRLFLESAADAVAAQYSGGLGVPAIFSETVFDQLLALTGDRGARQVLLSPTLNVLPFLLPEAAIDIDTPGDFNELKRR